MENKKFWDNIDKIFYINLDSRIDRQQSCLNELKSIGASQDKIERFSAIKKNPGYIGCTLGHISCLKLAMERNYETVMIVEDDILFTQKEWISGQLNKVFEYDFDVFLLGTNLFDFEKIDDSMIRVLGGGSTIGYIVKKHYYDKLLKNYKEGLELLLKTGKKPQYTIDSYALRTLHPIDRWITFSKLTVSQLHDYSDIENHVINYDCYMLKNINHIQKIQYRLPN